MAEIGAFGAKTHFSRLLARVERGEEIVITRRGHRVAKLTPYADDRERAKATIRRLKDSAATTTLGGLSLRALIDEGRV